MSLSNWNIGYAPKVLYSLSYGNGRKLTVDLIHVMAIDLRAEYLYIRLDTGEYIAMACNDEVSATNAYDALYAALMEMVTLGGGKFYKVPPSEG